MSGDFSAPVVNSDYAVLLDGGGHRVHEVVTLGNGDLGYIDYRTLSIEQATTAPVLLRGVEPSVREALLSLISPAHKEQVVEAVSDQ